MKQKFLALTLAFSAVASLVSCQNNETPHVKQGTFYTFQKAYEEELLTVRDLEVIKEAISANALTIDEEVATSIKKDYYALLMEGGEKPRPPYTDIIIKNYYGAYKGSYVVVIVHAHVEYPAISLIETIGEIEFSLGLPSIQVWHTDDGENTPGDAEKVQSITLMMNFDYSFYSGDKPTLLIGDSLVFFNPLDYGISKLIAGDLVTINYIGEFLIQEIYPGIVATKYFEIESIEVKRATIVEYEILENAEGALALVTQNEDYISGITFAREYVLQSDGTFRSLESYLASGDFVGTKLYGTSPVGKRSKEIVAIYAYNPAV